MNIHHTTYRYILLLLLLLLQGFLWNGGLLAQERVALFDMIELREEADSLLVSYDVRLPERLVTRGQGFRISPFLQAGDSLLVLPRITVLGKNKQKVLHRYHTNSGLGVEPRETLPDGNEPLTYRVRVPYREWMDSARMYIRQEVSGYRGVKLTTGYLLNGRVELQVREPYQVNPSVAFITPEKVIKTRNRQGKAYLDFPVGRSVILPDFRRNPEELRKINDAISDVTGNRDATVTGLFIEGYASPEGKYETNERLASARASALKEYIRNNYHFDEIIFKVSSVAEDWDGLTALVQASDMDYKEQVLSVIASTDILDGRERKLMTLAKGIPYRKMLKEMFPELRRVEYRIDYTVRDYGIEESKLLLQAKPENLSHLEFYTLALHLIEAGDSVQYTNILLESIPKYFPEDMASRNNSAAIMIQSGELNTAKRLLEKCGDLPEVWNNMGVIMLLAGEYEEAEKLLIKARQAGVRQAAHNLRELETKLEDNKKMQRYKRQ